MATNKELSVAQRASLFVYSAPNVAGSVLALGGLALLWAGIIDAYWWAIVAGLYGAGILGWPRNEVTQKVEKTRLSTQVLGMQVRNLIDHAAVQLPGDASALLRSTQATLHELLPQLLDLESRGVISQKDSFTVLETVRRYLPDTLVAYLRLPKAYAHSQVLADGSTASQTLLQQLSLLDASLKEIASIAFSGNGELLIRNGRFLEARFSKTSASPETS